MNPSFQKINSLFVGYTLGKDAFIRNILKQTGFNSLRLMQCTHHLEWEAYHRIRAEQLFNPLGIIYDQNHPSLTDKNYFHFVLYQGTQIVSVAMVEFWNLSDAVLRALATDQEFQCQGFGKYMLNLLEEWIKYHGKLEVKTHAASRAEHFYRRLGYTEIEFDDPSISKDSINLGKIL